MSVLQLEPLYEFLDVIFLEIAGQLGLTPEAWERPLWRSTGRGVEISWKGPNGKRLVLYEDGRYAFRGLVIENGKTLSPGDRRWLGRAVRRGMWSEAAREAIEYFRRLRRERQ